MLPDDVKQRLQVETVRRGLGLKGQSTLIVAALRAFLDQPAETGSYQLSDTGSLKSSEQWHELLDVILASEQPVLISAITRTIEAFAAASGPREPISAEGVPAPPVSADIARIRERARRLDQRSEETQARGPEDEEGTA